MTAEAVTAVQLGADEALEVFASLTDEEWARPSGCVGWRVQDVAAHLGSNWKETADPSPPPDEPLPALPAERMMDLLVEPRLAWTPAQVLDELRTYAPALLATLQAMQDEPLASAPLPLADLGTYPMHELADAYAFDVYCHLRIDVLAPHGPVERALAPADRARLAPAIGWMLAGLPQMQGAAFGLLDRPITLELTGPADGAWSIVPVGGGAVAVEPGAAADGAARVVSSGHDFVLWGTKRAPWRELTTVDGDAELAAAFLDALNIV